MEKHSPIPHPDLPGLLDAIGQCMLTDRRRLRRMAEALATGGERMDERLAHLAGEIGASAQRVIRRRQALPVPEYPEELPIVAQKGRIMAAIAEHPVVIVCGETGSGKSTQLPKFCLEMGRGVGGMIGHTQPRRIAARSTARRIAEELGGQMGEAVGYKVRFRDRVGPATFIKVMTDGILLAEIQSDRRLEAYDTLIIDEAHERSLNIDFLLGYLNKILAERPDLKLVITSATIDPERFSRAFGNAPVIEVSGRTYPVEIRYRPPQGKGEEAEAEGLQPAILAAVDELAEEGPGDILVFLPGEREIRETAESLRKHHPPHTEILPLFARLSSDEQDRVFAPAKGRRIVLSTNVAETSLTVPGIHYVADTGLARISRYSARVRMQRLPVERISQASAKQRAGRCGRVSDGVCIRLYSEEDLASRPPFTDPEIHRTALAAVLLRMLALRLGEIESFPFVDPPDRRQIQDGFDLLTELGAVDRERRITPLGQQMHALPVDPRVARMVLAAARLNCLAEILVIAAALSVQDPREIPADAQEAARQAHRRFNDESSDFVAWLNLWRFFHESARHLSQNKLRRLCRDHYLSYLRMREWNDIHGELAAQVKQMGLRPNTVDATYEEIHRALLTGLLGNIGKRDERREYQGTRQSRFTLFPASGISKKPPEWVMAAAIVETAKPYARSAARIAPEWVEEMAGHLVKRTAFEPHWEMRRGAVMAFERVSLYGLVINPKRPVHYGPMDPETARGIFIRSALVEGNFRTRAPFFAHNQTLVAEFERIAAKTRQRDVAVSDDLLYGFYDERIPPGIHNVRDFDKWRRTAEQDNPRHLFLTREELLARLAQSDTATLFPDTLDLAGAAFPLSYRFKLGDPEDGVTLTVPLAALNSLPVRIDRLVPGMLREKIVFLLRTLPKQFRKACMPFTRFADLFLAHDPRPDAALTEALAMLLKTHAGIDVPETAWRADQLPPHFHMNIRVVDTQGNTLATGRDREKLAAQLGTAAARRFSDLPKAAFERSALTAWEVGDLDTPVPLADGAFRTMAYPALADENGTVALRLFETPESAEAAHRAGVLRLFELQLAPQLKLLSRNSPITPRIALHYASLGSADVLRAQFLRALLAEALLAEGPVRTRQLFEARVGRAQASLVARARHAADALDRVLAEYHAVATTLGRQKLPPQTVADIRDQLGRLVYPGFLAATPLARLERMPYHLRGILMRIQKCVQAPARDIQRMQEIAPLWQPFWTQADQAPERLSRPDWERFRWLLEELRISLFAQETKTVEPVSVKRLEPLWNALSAAR